MYSVFYWIPVTITDATNPIFLYSSLKGFGCCKKYKPIRWSIRWTKSEDNYKHSVCINSVTRNQIQSWCSPLVCLCPALCRYFLMAKCSSGRDFAPPKIDTSNGKEAMDSHNSVGNVNRRVRWASINTDDLRDANQSLDGHQSKKKSCGSTIE